MNKKIIENLVRLVSDIRKNENITVSAAEVRPGYSAESLDEMENGLGIKYHEELRSFYGEVGEVTISWFVDMSRFSDVIPEEEINYLGGGISIINPFDMIMGLGGQRWKNELWFDNMDPAEQQQIRSFAPFDFANPNLVAGFKMQEGKVLNEVQLLHSSDGMLGTALHLESYLELAVKTKGLSFWPRFINDPDSDGYQRYIKFMPMLFSDMHASE